MAHGASTDWGKDNAIKAKTKLGAIMFICYAIIYAGFIFINVTSPKLMQLDIGGLNLAIVYGFGLIILALVLALIYNAQCTRMEKRMNEADKKERKVKS